MPRVEKGGKLLAQRFVALAVMPANTACSKINCWIDRGSALDASTTPRPSAQVRRSACAGSLVASFIVGYLSALEPLVHSPLQHELGRRI